MTEFVEAASYWLSANPLSRLFLMLMVSDILMGLLRAAKERKLSSTVSSNGTFKKAAMMLCVAVAEIMEPYVQGQPLSEIVAGSFSVSEGLSVLENAAILGVPIPQALKDALAKVSALTKSKELPGDP